MNCVELKSNAVFFRVVPFIKTAILQGTGFLPGALDRVVVKIGFKLVNALFCGAVNFKNAFAS